MSKRKFKKPPKQAPKAAATEKQKAGFAKSFAQMLFIVLGALSSFYVIYIALTPKRGDTVNDYILANMPKLLTTEWIFYSLIAAGFVYCAFKWVFNSKKHFADVVVLATVFIAINGLFSLSFDKDIGSFGDNAQYIIHSKTLLERGGTYDVYSPNETYKARAPIGFPLMLSPITAIYGMDVIKMKKLVFFLGSMSLVFFFLAFRKMTNRYLAAMMAILIGTYPLLIYNTTYVMTEVPFCFSIALALFCLMKLKEAESRRSMITWITLATLTTFLVYMTRAVGVAMIAGVVAWLFFQVPWIKIFKKETAWISPAAIKFGVMTALLAVFTIALQLNTSAKASKANALIVAEQINDDADEAETKEEMEARSNSQMAQFLSSDFAKNFNTNFKKVNVLWAQQVFNRDLSRWYLSLGKAAKIKPMGPGLRFFNIILAISLIIGLFRRDLMAFIFIFLIGVTLAGTSTPVLIVYSRYFIPFVPFIIYFMARFLIDAADLINRRKPMPMLQGYAAFGTSIFLFMILNHNFSGAAFNTQRQNAGDTYTIAFDNYIKSAKWMKENIKEEGVIVASRKPRLFYVFSEMQGVFTVTYSNMQYSQEMEQERIEYFREKGIDYIILDAFSTASRKVMWPIIQNNPDLFQIIESVGEKYPSYVVKFNG